MCETFVNPMGVIALEALADGVLGEAEAMLEGSMQPLILLRSGQQVRGWRNSCPHAGRRLDLAPGQFLLTKKGHLVCAAHGATFDLQSGQCVSGPCRGQALHPVPVVVRDGWVSLAE